MALSPCRRPGNGRISQRNTITTNTLNRNTKKSWRKLTLALPIVISCLVFCQCKPVRTVTPRGTTGYKFKGINENELASEKKKNEGASRIANTLKNEKTIKNSKGEVVKVEKRDNLYADRSAATARETGSTFNGKKQAKVGKNKVTKKEFKTPEYLKNSEFAGTKSFRDAGQTARESGSENKRVANKLFQTKSNSTGDNVARESGSTNRNSDKSFKTALNRTASKAQDNAAIPTPFDGMRGYRDNAHMTVDDVKKLVTPEAIQ